MRLLWMKSDYVIPPDTGGKIRTYNLLRELHRLCDVTYLSFKTSKSPNREPEIETCARKVVTVYKPEEKKEGFGFYGRVLCRMASRLPYVIQKYHSPMIVAYQRSFIYSGDRPTVVLCDFLEMAENVDWNLPCPKVLFQHNVESMIWRRYCETETNWLKKAYCNYERKRMTRYESEICNRFDLVFTVSEEDKEKLKNDYGVTRPIEVLETGVNTEFFSPDPATKPEPSKLVFLGSLDWMPNIDGMKWFTQEVYPLIKQKQLGVTLDIVGRRPVSEISRLAEVDKSIRVIGNVPDVRPHIATGELFIVPLRIGGGSRIKIYEAMAMNRPVVSTTIGAEGLSLLPNEHIVIGDSPKEFADQATRLLEDKTKQAQISKSGYDLVTQHYQWKNVAMKLRDHCQQLSQAI